jgi:hypothetical protein
MTTETKDIWIAWSNTDLTEGRGYPTIRAVAWSYETALRLGRKGSVMGCDCHVSKEIAYKIGERWYVPGVTIHQETKEDESARVNREARESAIAKARAAGMSDEEIAALTGGR